MVQPRPKNVTWTGEAWKNSNKVILFLPPPSTSITCPMTFPFHVFLHHCFLPHSLPSKQRYQHTELKQMSCCMSQSGPDGAWYQDTWALGSYPGKARFESRPGQGISWDLSWLSSVPEGECWDSASIRPQPLVSKSFTIRHPSIQRAEPSHWKILSITHEAGLDTETAVQTRAGSSAHYYLHAIAGRVWTGFYWKGFYCVHGTVLLSALCTLFIAVRACVSSSSLRCS
jgi:hypothetical protein